MSGRLAVFGSRLEIEICVAPPCGEPKCANVSDLALKLGWKEVRAVEVVFESKAAKY